jgi:hypothetical protein
MNEPTYTQNSQKEIAPTEKRVQQVVKNPVKVKKNEIRKLADIFISEDVANVKEYIFMDVLVPAIKKAIYDIVTNGIDMFLYGGNGKAKSNGGGSRVSYGSYYDQKNHNSPSNYRGSENTKSHSAFDYMDISFDTRRDAELVLDQLQGAISRFGYATINDFYDSIPDDMLPNSFVPFTGAKYGWINLSGVRAVNVRGRWVLNLPKAVPID